MMKNLKIAYKLLASFTAVALLIVALASLSAFQLRRLNGKAAELADIRVPALTLTDTMNIAKSDFATSLHAHVLAKSDADTADAERRIARSIALVNTSYEALRTKLDDPAAIRTAESFHRKWRDYQPLAAKVLAASRTNDDQKSSYYLQRSRAAFDSLSRDLTNLSEIQRRLSARTAADSLSTYRLSVWLCLLAVAGALLLMTIVLVSLVRSIARPIAIVTDNLDALARGDMSVSAPIEQRADEVGKLGQSMNALRAQLVAAERAKDEQAQLIVSSLGRGLQALSDGDLTHCVTENLTGPFARLKNNFNQASIALGATLRSVSGSAAAIATGANEIKRASDDLSQRTEQQASSLEETAAALHEITATVRKTAANVTCANKVVMDTQSAAEQSGEVVRRAMDAMDGIERASAEIGDIIAVIDGIAFQTNLLALNAGVEAARAGDAGNGFAVVAGEVRALAQRSAEAARDVKSKITASAKEVDTGVALVEQAAQELGRITASIGQISALVSDIASAAEQQAAGLEQINTAVSEMDSVTQQNAAMVEEATAAVRTLADEAKSMSHQVGQFRIIAPSSSERISSPVHRLQKRAMTAVSARA